MAGVRDDRFRPLDGGASPSPASGSARLLATKLFVPRPRADLVARPRLLARLDAGLASARCTLLSAPAGSGKTSLLAAWLAAVPHPVAWLALDERDQDVYQMLRYLVAALQHVAPGCGRAALAWLDAPPPRPAPEAVLTELVNDLAGLAGAGLLVLDDYHLVRAPAIHEAIQFLLEHLPPAVHLVVATREDPPLPLPRLRARGQVTEVRAADLRFTADEAASFLDQAMGVRLAPDEIATLAARTEGWAAGLQLAGLALRDRPDPSAFVATFVGGHRLVADYLTAEVLDIQPAASRRFLLTTSLVDRLCGPLSDALLAPDDVGEPAAAASTSDGQERLEALERANLFLIPLDDEGRWYRYHHLFADALRARLAREVGADGVAALHRRASAWFAREGLLAEAIQHALAAGAFDDAARWVESSMPSMLTRGSAFHQLETWLAALPEAVVRSRPRLCLGRVWLFISAFDQASAAEWADAAERALESVDSAVARRLRGSIAAARAYMGVLGPAASPERARTFAEQALAELTPRQPAFVMACLSLGIGALAQGQPRQAVRSLGEAAAAGRAAGHVFSALIAAGQQVSILSILGERRQALATGEAALAWAAEQHHPSGRGIGPLSAAVADLLREGNEQAAALLLASDGLRILRTHEHEPSLFTLACLSVARAHLALGDAASATEVLAEARPLVRYPPFAVLNILLDAVDADARLALGDVSGAVDWATSAPDIRSIAELVRFNAPVYAAGVQTLGGAARILAWHARTTGDATLLGQAERALDAAWELAERQGLGWLRLQVLIQRALNLDHLGNRDAALSALWLAVAAAGPEGYVRPLLEGGAPMVALLEAVRVDPERGDVRERPAVAFVDALLAAFPDRAASPNAGPGPPRIVADGARRVSPTQHAALAEPLTGRERDVLRLLGDGRLNAEIARALVVEQSTVKTHLLHLYGKLGVRSRTQAVARARALQLLD